jgi:hypothetical protein
VHVGARALDAVGVLWLTCVSPVGYVARGRHRPRRSQSRRSFPTTPKQRMS